MWMRVNANVGNILICALIVIGIVIAFMAIAVPYVVLSIFAGPQDAVYLVVVFTLFLIFRRKHRTAGVLTSLICALLLSFPVSTFIIVTNDNFVAAHPTGPFAEMFTDKIGNLIYRFAYSAAFLLLLDYLLNKLRGRTDSKEKTNSDRLR